MQSSENIKDKSAASDKWAWVAPVTGQGFRSIELAQSQLFPSSCQGIQDGSSHSGNLPHAMHFAKHERYKN